MQYGESFADAKSHVPSPRAKFLVPSPPAASWSLMSAHRIRPINATDKPRPSAQYIGELTRELARLARTDGCETLSYLLELATIEAELMGGPPEGQRLS